MDKPIRIENNSTVTSQIEIVLKEGYYVNQANYERDTTITLEALIKEYKRLKEKENYINSMMVTIESALYHMKGLKNED